MKLFDGGKTAPQPVPYESMVPKAIKDAFHDWIAEVMNQGVHVHSKVIVIDPFGKKPVVITGSHNLGHKASTANDDNMMIVVGNAPLAAAYAANIIAIFQNYRWNTYVDAHAKDPQVWHGLVDNATWQDSYLSATSNDLPRSSSGSAKARHRRRQPVNPQPPRPPAARRCAPRPQPDRRRTAARAKGKAPQQRSRQRNGRQKTTCDQESRPRSRRQKRKNPHPRPSRRRNVATAERSGADGRSAVKRASARFARIDRVQIGPSPRAGRGAKQAMRSQSQGRDRWNDRQNDPSSA